MDTIHNLTFTALDYALQFVSSVCIVEFNLFLLYDSRRAYKYNL